MNHFLRQGLTKLIKEYQVGKNMKINITAYAAAIIIVSILVIIVFYFFYRWLKK